MRETQLAAAEVHLLETLEEARGVQAQAAHKFANELIAHAGDLGGLLDLGPQLRL